MTANIELEGVVRRDLSGARQRLAGGRRQTDARDGTLVVRRMVRRLRELEAVQAAARALSGPRRLEATLSRLAATATDGLRVPVAAVLRIADGTATVVAESSTAEPLTGTAFAVEDDPVLDRVVRRGRADTGPLRAQDPLGALCRAGVDRLAMGPLEAADRLTAVLCVGAGWERGFDSWDLRLLEELCALGGPAIATAEVLQAMDERVRASVALEQAKARTLNLCAHELRTPLSVLCGYLSMLRDGTFGPAQAADVHGIVGVLVSKADEMNTLIDDMLETARLDDHRLALALAPVDLRSVARRAADRVRTMVLPNQSLQIDDGDDDVPVLADEPRVESIVANLLHNAVKYSPRGGEIRCSVRRQGPMGEIAVEDRGIGIAEEHMERLFTRFGRILTQETRHIPGTGLGLYVSRELALLHGGDLTVRSAPGEGSIFTLRLPLAAS